ncbi:MAG TPA: zinc ABC transporter substrate-binding protein [Deltaproteobacteria bacterium]|nr:zinc ABC transporter substrate-binding protein [Deltaproteobacteria bacterium]
MKRALLFLVAASVLCTMLSTVCAAEAASGKIKVFVSIIPQAYFVERVGGEYVEVEVLVGPGQSPATYEPTPRQMSQLGSSRVYFRIGVPFEKVFMPKISSAFSQLSIVDTSEGVPLLYFNRSDGRQVADPHIWLDPKRVKIQAETICTELIRLDPDHADFFRQNLKTFHEDLDAVDASIAESLETLRGSTLYVFHPAFGYFAQSYGLQQVAIEVEGKQPSARQLSDLINKARAEKVKIIFVQPQYSKKNAQTIAQAISGAVVPINPLPENYLDELRMMASIIRNALSQE